MSVRGQLLSYFLRPTVVPRKLLSSEVQKTVKPPQPSGANSSATPQEQITLSATRKRMFVYAGLYKRFKDVPDVISATTFRKHMDRWRVRASLVLMALTGLGSFTSVMLAKGVLFEIESERDAERK